VGQGPHGTRRDARRAGARRHKQAQGLRQQALGLSEGFLTIAQPGSDSYI